MKPSIYPPARKKSELHTLLRWSDLSSAKIQPSHYVTTVHFLHEELQTSHILCALDVITALKFYQNSIRFASISVTGFYFQVCLEVFLKKYSLSNWYLVQQTKVKIHLPVFSVKFFSFFKLLFRCYFQDTQ